MTVLARENRLTSTEEFGRTVRGGRRAGSRTLVVYSAAGPSGPRVGFVVSKGVGGAVIRNRVKRRLRHLMRARVATLRPDVTVVIRALPPAATAPSSELAADLDRCLDRVNR